MDYEKRTVYKRKREFSKILITLILVVTLVIIIFAMVMIWRTNDTSALAYLIPAVFTETATATGFYYYKARAENELKIKRQVYEDERRHKIIMKQEGIE